MKIKLELFGASREFSNKDHLEFEIKEKIEIKDFRKELINYLDKNFKGNKNFIRIVESSAFCSESNNIIIFRAKNRVFYNFNKIFITLEVFI